MQQHAAPTGVQRLPPDPQEAQPRLDHDAPCHVESSDDDDQRRDIEALAQTIHDRLQLSIDKEGAGYEMNLYGRKGGFTIGNILIGYREGEPCPACGTPIEKIKTGSTSSFICPRCQPLKG